MNLTIHPRKLAGTVIAPSSKSAAHRALIAAALAQGESTLANIGNNDDIVASIACATALGAGCTIPCENSITVTGIASPTKEAILNCKESGSTLRFFTPIAAALGSHTLFQGEGRLPERPMEPLLTQLIKHGISVTHPKEGMFQIKGKLTPGSYTVAGNVSSQYITGLLFALPLLAGNSEITLTTPLESVGYIRMTLQTLEQYGIQIETTAQGYKIPGGQEYKPFSQTIEGDYSGAAFWLSAAALGQAITVTGLSPDSLQADTGILKVLRQLGAIVEIKQGAIHVTPKHPTATEIDATNIPDCVPILAVVAALTPGTTRIYNAQRLRIKESDRLAATQAGLSALGANIAETEDGLLITGVEALHGGVVDSFADHRIAMAMAIAALFATEDVTILGAECVEKSYPAFFDDLKALGGEYHVL